MRRTISTVPKTDGQLTLFTKRCCDCSEVKDIEQFHYCSRSPDRRQYRCIPCRAAYDRGRRVIVSGVSVTGSRSIAQLLAGWSPPQVALMEATGV